MKERHIIFGDKKQGYNVIMCTKNAVHIHVYLPSMPALEPRSRWAASACAQPASTPITVTANPPTIHNAVPVRPLDPWYENMTSSVKPEVHNLSQRRQRRTEPQPQTTCTKNLVKFDRAVFELCERTHRLTNRQTNRYTNYNTLHLSRAK